MSYDPDKPETWPAYRPLIMAHDVGRTRDRSTAVLGGGSPFQHGIIGIGDLRELPVRLYGSARASALAAVDREYNNNALIVADLSNDATYAEVLHETFGPRVIGLHISRHGDGMNAERRQVKNGSVLVYTVGRTHLIELYHTELQADQVRLVDNAMSKRAFQQLNELETELRDTGIVYTCLPGRHDDLGISCAMLVFAARHPHLPYWTNTAFAARRRRPQPPPFNWSLACT